MMLRLRCTVRGCGLDLACSEAVARCARGHAFDRARDGYWSLLQPQDRRRSAAGDRDVATAARAAWLARGFASGLLAAMREEIDALRLPPGSAAIDIGCGDGAITAAVLGDRGLEVCGIDLATHAIRRAARAHPALTWVVANADRALPLADHSSALALSIFGRRPAGEMRRVLDRSGTAILVLPGEDDLIELRGLVQGEKLRRDRVDEALAALSPAFSLVRRRSWRSMALHDRDALSEALAMTYRGARRAERARLGEAASLTVTLSAEILVLRPAFA